MTAGEGAAAGDGEAKPLVTVIVPVLGAEGLRGCLEALSRQEWPPERIEVLVVANGPPGPAEGAAAGLPGVRVLAEARPGSYAARNAGIAAARGSVVAFTDADCRPTPGWVAAGVARLRREPGTGLVAGRITLTFVDPARPTAVELYESAASFRQEHYVRRFRFGATANVFTTAEVLRRAGPFLAEMRSLGDMEWGRRVHAAGYAVVYADEVEILHPARRTLAEFGKRAARMTGGFRDAARRAGWPLRDLLACAGMGLPPAREVLGWGSRRRLRAGLLPRVKVVAVAGAIVAIRVVEMVRLALGGTPGR
jgi:glycosyltransferase involved in cell wall biosynthesis